MAYDVCPRCDTLFRCEMDQDADGNKITHCTNCAAATYVNANGRVVRKKPSAIVMQPRYKPGKPRKDGKPARHNVPYKRYYYLPLGDWIKDLFKLPWFLDKIGYGPNTLAETLRRLANNSRYTVEDIWNGKIFQALLKEYPSILSDPLSIFLGIAADGFQPFNSKWGGKRCAFRKAKSYTVTPITATIFNLPPHLRTRHGALHIVGMVPPYTRV